MDWLPSVLLAVCSAKRGSRLLAVWVIAYVSRTLFAWHVPLPLGLGISSLASVVLAGHCENLYVFNPYVDLPLELKISSSLASVVLAEHRKTLSFLSLCLLAVLQACEDLFLLRFRLLFCSLSSEEKSLFS